MASLESAAPKLAVNSGTEPVGSPHRSPKSHQKPLQLRRVPADDHEMALGPLVAPSRRLDPDISDPDAARVIERLLRAVRQHLDLDAAFVGEVSGGRRTFRYVDSKPGVDAIAVGDSDPLEESYCGHVLSGRLPQFLADPAQHPVAAALPVTKALPVGSHLSVPIRFSDGRVYGTFCCFGLRVSDSIAAHDLRAVQMTAQLAGEYLEAIEAAQRDRRQRGELIEKVLADPDAMALVFQPLRDLATMEVVSVEALSRFPGQPHNPAWFFSEAAAAGLGVALEMRAVCAALDVLPRIPSPVRLNVNVSPDTLCSWEFFEAVAGVPRDRLVVEVTEHAAIDDYTELKAASARLSEQGIWLAIDDLGMGFSGLNRILQSSPEELKLDAAVIRDVDSSSVKRALVEALCSFGEHAGFGIVAEGIETAGELRCLRDLGAKIGQGYFLGRPGELETWFGHGCAGPSLEGASGASSLR